MPENLTLVFWLWAILGAPIGAAIGQRKGRAGAGFFFGLIIGPIGWIIMAVGPDLRQRLAILCRGRRRRGGLQAAI